MAAKQQASALRLVPPALADLRDNRAAPRSRKGFSMSLLLKDPEAILDYSVDWGAEYLGDDLLVTSSWAVVPSEPGGVTISGDRFDAKVSTVKAGGGIPGRIYRLDNHVTMSSGREDNRSIVLRVEQR
jgi:hypothetical protein